MEKDYKIINDTVHGSVRVDEPFLELISTPEMAKLFNIRQLGLAYLVFPGANHTRLEHSIGVFHVTGLMCKALELDSQEALLVKTAALLHDIGHGPFSHTLEYIVHNSKGYDHMDRTKDIITGRRLEIPRDEEFDKVRTIPEILESVGLDPKEVAALITGDNVSGSQKTMDTFDVQDNQGFFNTKQYLGQMIHSTCDADQVDYLLRDAHYTGVTHGSVDVNRLMNTIEISNNDLVISKRGIEAIEGILVSRALMYSSVYFHKTVRLAEVMLSYAVEGVPEEQLEKISTMTDAELLSHLESLGGYTAETVKRLRYRRLFKVAHSVEMNELTEEKKLLSYFTDPRNRRRVEEQLCNKLGVPKGSILIDNPHEEIKLSEPRIKMIDIGVKQGSNIVPFSRCSPLARALQVRDVPDWAIVVYAPREHRDEVSKLAQKTFNEIQEDIQ